MGESRHTLWDLLLNTDRAGGASQIFSPTPMITQGPLKGKGALLEKINTISEWVFKKKIKLKKKLYILANENH